VEVYFKLDTIYLSIGYSTKLYDGFVYQGGYLTSLAQAGLEKLARAMAVVVLYLTCGSCGAVVSKTTISSSDNNNSPIEILNIPRTSKLYLRTFGLTIFRRFKSLYYPKSRQNNTMYRRAKMDIVSSCVHRIKSCLS
jgi:hypothetical protein